MYTFQRAIDKKRRLVARTREAIERTQARIDGVDDTEYWKAIMRTTQNDAQAEIEGRLKEIDGLVALAEIHGYEADSQSFVAVT